MERNESTLHTITLSDGSSLGDLRLNGNNYICDALSPEDVRSRLDGNLRPVTIDGEVHEEMAIVHITRYGDETWFALRDVTELEKKLRQLRADIEYLSMMTDNELEGDV